MSAMPEPAIAKATPEEYLALERKAEYRSEYLNGEIFAMAGASREHNLITGNVFGEIRQQLRGRAGEVYSIDVRVKVEDSGLYTYPDVAVVCEDPEFEDNEVDTLLNTTTVLSSCCGSCARRGSPDPAAPRTDRSPRIPWIRSPLRPSGQAFRGGRRPAPS